MQEREGIRKLYEYTPDEIFRYAISRGYVMTQITTFTMLKVQNQGMIRFHVVRPLEGDNAGMAGENLLEYHHLSGYVTYHCKIFLDFSYQDFLVTHSFAELGFTLTAFAQFADDPIRFVAC